VYQKRLNDWYETHQTAFGPTKGCIGKLDRCSDYKTCGKLLVNETVETLVTSTFLSADYIVLIPNFGVLVREIRVVFNKVLFSVTDLSI
jgi:hypothetical protein